MVISKFISNLKLVAFLALACVAIWFYKDYVHQKKENIRQTNNVSNLKNWLLDSVAMAQQIYTQKEINSYLETSNVLLGDKLKNDRIKFNRIEQIITQSLHYQDTTINTTQLPTIVEGVKKGIKVIQPFKDVNPCLIIEGYVMYKNDSLSLNITNRKFTNKSEVVSYWRRRQWRFLGIPTRFLGKKEVTVKIYDECGNTQTFLINKK